MSNEFTWYPDTGHSLAEKPKVRVISFGDGYEARFKSGMNNLAQKWSLKFSRGRVEADAILTFLRAKGATFPFKWKPPIGELGSYICRDWKVSIDKGLVVITCDFEQVFEKVV